MKIVDPCTAGDPDQDGVLWTNLSRPRIAQELLQQGFRVSVNVVSQLLQRHRLGRRKARKALPLGEHPHRDRQFRIIAHYRAEFDQSPDPIVSMDTKAKEFLGLLFREGRLYPQKAKKALDHDFPSAALGVLYPYGLYDTKRNLGHLNLGLSHDTSRFACAVWVTGGKPMGASRIPTLAGCCSCATAAAATPPDATFSNTIWNPWRIALAWKFAWRTTRLSVRSTIPSSIDSSRTLRKLAKACC